jgi:hypothetical protein
VLRRPHAGLHRLRRTGGQRRVVGELLLAGQRQQVVDDCFRIRRHLTLRYLLHHRVQLVEAGLQHGDQRRGLGRIGHRLLQHRLDRVGEVAHRHQALRCAHRP